MGERYRSPPNEEIRSGFGSWLLFFKNLPMSASLVLDNVTSRPLIHQQFKQEEMEGPSTLSRIVLKSHLFIF